MFTEGGAHEYLTDLHGRGSKSTQRSCMENPGSAFGFEANARSRDAMEKVVEDALKRFGRVDVLINNAADAPSLRSLEMTPNDVVIYGAEAIYRTMTAGLLL